MKVLTVNVSKKEYSNEKNKEFGILNYSINEHLKNKTYKKDALSKDNSFIISSGPFTGQGLPGAHRAIISGKSPLTKGFFFSTIGGVGEEIYRTNNDTIKIVGKAKEPSIVLIRFKDNKLTVKVEQIKQLSKIYNNNGVFSLQEYLVKKYADFFKGVRYRSIVAGSSGFNSIMGGLSSVMVKNNKLDYGSEGFAGRGGYGSVLAQAHNIAGIIFGGDYKKEKSLAIQKIVSKTFNKKNIYSVASEKTKKYRGKGTLLSNFEGSKNDSLFFNWNNIYLDKKERLKKYNTLIKDSYIKDYDKIKIISKTCGEACPALCKKVQGEHVKDYEPYSSCGPNMGIFTQKSAQNVVNTVDAMGFDAISFGNLIGVVFEALEKNLITPKELGIDEKPSFDIKNFNIKDSKKNASIAIKLAKLMVNNKNHILNKGIRNFVEEKNIDFGVFFCFGKKGVISPNQYLRPGFVAPLPIVGKFSTYYGKEFIGPFKLGKLSAQRLIKELYNEDTGFCRFHRGWAEELIPKLINEIYNIDYEEHIRTIISKIIEYNTESDSLPKKWCGKVRDVVKYHLFINNEKTKDSEKWIKKFKQDSNKAIDEYWKDLIKGISSVLGGEYKDVISR